jgi:hypothetical protein
MEASMDNQPGDDAELPSDETTDDDLLPLPPLAGDNQINAEVEKGVVG